MDFKRKINKRTLIQQYQCVMPLSYNTNNPMNVLNNLFLFSIEFSFSLTQLPSRFCSQYKQINSNTTVPKNLCKIQAFDKLL